MAEEGGCSFLIPRGCDPDDNYDPGNIVSLYDDALTKPMQGYDYEFVSPLESKYECPICLLCQRDPTQTSCGHRFCRSCITTWIRKGKHKCPEDNYVITEDNLFYDNFAKREILSLSVRCPNKLNGCSEIAELGKIEDHIENCQFRSVPCPNACSVTILKRDLDTHLTNDCLKRIIKCKLCFAGFPLNEQQSHFMSCPMVTVACECEELMSRQQLAAHKESKCPKALVFCNYYEVGCQEKFERQNLDAHLESNTTQHLWLVTNALKDFQLNVGNLFNNSPPVRPNNPMSQWLEEGGNEAVGATGGTCGKDANPENNVTFAAPFYESVNNGYASFAGSLVPAGLNPDMIQELFQNFVGLKQTMREQELKLEVLRVQMREQKQELSTALSRLELTEGRFCNGVHYWRIINFTRLRAESEQGHSRVLHSPGFYTSCYGYKVCLRLNIQCRDADSAFVSLFIHLMQGEFDDLLTWPFVGKITLSILDQSERTETKNDVTETMHTKPGLTAFRKPTTERNPKGFGYTEFVAVENLVTGPYLKNDTLIVRAVVTV